MFRWILLGAAAASALVLSVCAAPVDPDRGRFSCRSEVDCGAGYVCVQQANGSGGRCFRSGDCGPERCNGLDDDCDGVVDNGFDLTSDNRNCGVCGQVCSVDAPCAAGACREAACANHVDDDGNGLTDCEDPSCAGKSCALDDVSLNCGHDDAGERRCVPREVDCGNGVDDDGDGFTDCQDLDCEGQGCDGGTCRSGSCAP